MAPRVHPSPEGENQEVAAHTNGPPRRTAHGRWRFSGVPAG